MVLKAIQKSTLQEGVYDQIYQSILSGKIAPGERLTLRKLAEDLNVSAMPVREALRRLEARNFITIQSNKQIIVNELTPDRFKQIFEARILLEGHAAKRASKLRSEKSLVELETRMKQMWEAQDEYTLLKRNTQFHQAIYREARLPVFMELIDSLWERVSPYFYIISKDEEYWVEKTYMENHVRMLEGMRNKDPKAVYHWLKKDLSGAAKAVYAMFKRERDRVKM